MSRLAIGFLTLESSRSKKTYSFSVKRLRRSGKLEPEVTVAQQTMAINIFLCLAFGAKL